MINGTRCNACGDFIYARKIPGQVKPEELVCEDCGEFDRVAAEPQMR